MLNPWEEIRLDDYENHMSLDSVQQLQMLDSLMKDQLNDYDVSTAMILGIAGGNGLDHVNKDKYSKVYGVDINEDYLKEVSKRYSHLSDVLCCLHLDLIKENERLPHAELLIANLLIEYIGYEAFQKTVMSVAPKYLSCVIQINTDIEQWVSDSPYIHAFDRLDEIHNQMDEKELTSAIEEIGFHIILDKTYKLPNGKALQRIDYQADIPGIF